MCYIKKEMCTFHENNLMFEYMHTLHNFLNDVKHICLIKCMSFLYGKIFQNSFSNYSVWSLPTVPCHAIVQKNNFFQYLRLNPYPPLSCFLRCVHSHWCCLYCCLFWDKGSLMWLTKLHGLSWIGISLNLTSQSSDVTDLCLYTQLTK